MTEKTRFAVAFCFNNAALAPEDMLTLNIRERMLSTITRWFDQKPRELPAPDRPLVLKDIITATVGELRGLLMDAGIHPRDDTKWYWTLTQNGKQRPLGSDCEQTVYVLERLAKASGSGKNPVSKFMTSGREPLVAADEELAQCLSEAANDPAHWTIKPTTFTDFLALSSENKWEQVVLSGQSVEGEKKLQWMVRRVLTLPSRTAHRPRRRDSTPTLKVRAEVTYWLVGRFACPSFTSRGWVECFGHSTDVGSMVCLWERIARAFGMLDRPSLTNGERVSIAQSLHYLGTHQDALIEGLTDGRARQLRECWAAAK